ncbi:MAG: hypothetical protein K6F20_02865 [Bacteroidaceae bacterium]|nr:hypothetical protein [Bacteroidaceae bacterium]
MKPLSINGQKKARRKAKGQNALEGHQHIAQGIALGSSTTVNFRPVRA